LLVLLLASAAAFEDVSYRKPAHQSSTDVDDEHFSADKAVDGDLLTFSGTKKDAVSWWSVDLRKQAEIFKIECYLNTFAHSKGYYGNFTVETRSALHGKWKLCSKVENPVAPVYPYVVNCDEPTTARYVKISVEPGKSLYLQEVQVMTIDLHNVASGKPTKASSEWADKWSSAKAVDGDGYTYFDSKNDQVSWWSIDLQQLTHVFEVRLYLNAHGLTHNDYGNFTLSTKRMKDDEWEVCKSMDVINQNHPSWPFTLRCGPDGSVKTARYIKISVHPLKNLYLHEVEVMTDYTYVSTKALEEESSVH